MSNETLVGALLFGAFVVVLAWFVKREKDKRDETNNSGGTRPGPGEDSDRIEP
jgi:hypothetical protein